MAERSTIRDGGCAKFTSRSSDF